MRISTLIDDWCHVHTLARLVGKIGRGANGVGPTASVVVDDNTLIACIDGRPDNQLVVYSSMPLTECRGASGGTIAIDLPAHMHKELLCHRGEEATIEFVEGRATVELPGPLRKVLSFPALVVPDELKPPAHSDSTVADVELDTRALAKAFLSVQHSVKPNRGQDAMSLAVSPQGVSLLKYNDRIVIAKRMDQPDAQRPKGRMNFSISAGGGARLGRIVRHLARRNKVLAAHFDPARLVLRGGLDSVMVVGQSNAIYCPPLETTASCDTIRLAIKARAFNVDRTIARSLCGLIRGCSRPGVSPFIRWVLARKSLRIDVGNPSATMPIAATVSAESFPTGKSRIAIDVNPYVTCEYLSRLGSIRADHTVAIRGDQLVVSWPAAGVEIRTPIVMKSRLPR